MYGNTDQGVGRGVRHGMATGRGMGAGPRMAAGRSLATGYNTEESMTSDEERPQAQVPQEQRMTYAGSYTRITPNEKKRQQIQRMAQQEETAYKSYKQQNTPTTVNYVGTAGGGELREADVRRKSQQEISKVQRLERKQQLVANKRSAEQVEIDKRKAEQRRKAEQNDLRKKKEEENGAHKWDEQRRRTNEAFLRRLENKSRNPPPTTIQDSDEGSPTRASKISSLSLGASSRLATNSGAIPKQPSNSQTTEKLSSRSRSTATGAANTSTSISRNTAVETSGYTDELQKKVIALRAIFPQYEENYLSEILEQLNGSLDEAVAVLQD